MEVEGSEQGLGVNFRPSLGQSHSFYPLRLLPRPFCFATGVTGAGHDAWTHSPSTWEAETGGP